MSATLSEVPIQSIGTYNSVALTHRYPPVQFVQTDIGKPFTWYAKFGLIQFNSKKGYYEKNMDEWGYNYLI